MNQQRKVIAIEGEFVQEIHRRQPSGRLKPTPDILHARMRKLVDEGGQHVDCVKAALEQVK